MISATDRRNAVELIDEARVGGARLHPACALLGLSARTYERWIRDGDVREDRRPCAARPKPANALTPEEGKRPGNYRISPSLLRSSIFRWCGSSAATASGDLAPGRCSKR